MFARQSIQYSASVAAGVGIFSMTSQQPILSETKRKFYEDESNVVPIPGTVTPAAGSELKVLGPNRLVDGISVRSPSSLESFFKQTRQAVINSYDYTQNYLNKGYTKYYETERQVTQTVSELHNKSEDLLPNSLYIVIATLSGNIMARQRGLVSKAIFPLALGLASFKYFLPQTFSNTTGFIWNLEERFVPQLAKSQEESVKKAGELYNKIEKTSESSQDSIHSGVQSLRKSIADVTGLNIDGEVTKK